MSCSADCGSVAFWLPSKSVHFSRGFFVERRMRTRRKKKKGTTHILVYCSDGLYSCCLKRAHTDHNSTARVGYLFIYYIAVVSVVG